MKDPIAKPVGPSVPQAECILVDSAQAHLIGWGWAPELCTEMTHEDMDARMTHGRVEVNG